MDTRMDEGKISEIVERVMAQIKHGESPPLPSAPVNIEAGDGIYRTIDEAVQAAFVAQKTWEIGRAHV